ncbi:hypothetical protein SELMODRAFT_97324 [Selaginella moellendorffii]|uniref:1-phosphatidylinositol 4-kinase n=1 Tax=Selaginella moellendorffii TaxID=88036 RepID=D8RMV0_SELML|nr:hypothetical protein SELMODRAFT_97324 [Selaginella moellendorffii]
MVRILGYNSGAEAEEPREITRTPSSSGDNGWLIRFFDSAFFCEWIAVSYLYKHEHSGVRDYLCNRMYTLPITGIESYLFQLCYMMITKPSPSLDKYIVDMCTKSLKIAVKVHWFLLAEAEDLDDNEEIRRLQEKCQLASLAGDWPPLIKPQKAITSPSGKSRMFKLLSSSSRRILPLTSSPIQKSAAVASATATAAAVSDDAPGSKASAGVKGSQEESSESSYRVFKKLMPATKVRDVLKKFRDKEEEDPDQSKDAEQESFFRRLFRDDERVVRSDELATESFFRRIFRDKSDGEDRVRGSVDEDEVKGLLFMFKKIFREKHDDRDKTDDEEKIWDEDEGSEFFLFRKFFRVHPEEESIFDSATFGTPENSPGADGFFKRLFRDKDRTGDESRSSSKKEDRSSPSLFKRLFKDKAEDSVATEDSVNSVSSPDNANASEVSSDSGRTVCSHVEVGTNDSEQSFEHRMPSTRLDFEDIDQRSDTSFSCCLVFTDIRNVQKRPGSPKQKTERGSSKPPLPRYSSFHIRKGTYHATLDFVRSLCDIASGLVDVFPMEDRRKALHESLAELNNHLASAEQDGGVCFPMGKGLYRVVHIPENDAVLMNSREKAPFLVCFEVLKCETESSVRDSRDSSIRPRGGIPLANGDAHVQRPPPWAYPVWNSQQSGSENYLRSASRAIDRAMAHDWETNVKVVELNLHVLERTDDSDRGEKCNESELVQVSLRAVVDMNMEDVGEDFTAKRKDHRRVPSTVAMDAVRAAAAKGEAPPGLPLKGSGTDQLGKSSDVVGGELWDIKKGKIKKTSVFGGLPGWDLRSAIVKSGDDCRQEHLAVQLVSHFYDIFQEAGLPLWLRPYEVLVTSSRAALIETIPDTASVHAIKTRNTSLREYFCKKYDENSPAFKLAQRNFVESMAGYSILCYFLQVKDRHNANLLIDEDGHIVHIDFGFMLSNSPGGVNFENAPFKLTREQLEASVMDSDAEGTASEFFDYFKVLCIQGFLTCRKHAERIILLVEMMQDSGCPCFRGGPKTILNLRKRFHLSLTEEQCVSLVLSLISSSLDAWRTRQYDYYQRVLNGIQ